MRTLVENKNQKTSSFIEEYPLLLLQKLIGFLVAVGVVAALYFMTQGDLANVSQVMMYPDVNFGLYSFSLLLFGYVVFVILRESWLMKTEIGLSIEEDHFVIQGFDWNTYQVSFDEVKEIVVSRLTDDADGGWFKVVLHNKSEYSVYLSELEPAIKVLPEKLKSIIKNDTKSLMLYLVSVFFVGSAVLLLTRLTDFYFFELIFYGIILVGFYISILFKKSLSKKKILRREFEVGMLFVVPALMVNFVSQWPLSDVDRLFYTQIQMIQSPPVDQASSLEYKIQLCEHINENYTNLKPTMVQELDRVCSMYILSDSTVSAANLERAFNWAYAQYVKKQETHQVISLACMYAETDQKDFAVQLARKHNMGDLARDLVKGSKCRPGGSGQARGLASVQ